MRSKSLYLLFLISILLGSFSWVSPWAAITVRDSGTGMDLTLPIRFLDTTFWVDGCPRGSAMGRDPVLDLWIWFGRITLLVQVSLWLAFLIGIIRRGLFKEFAGWSLGLIVPCLLLLITAMPTVECFYIRFPPPLIFLKQWQIGILAVLLSLSGILCGVWIIHSTPPLPSRNTENELPIKR